MSLNIDWLNAITYKSINPRGVEDFVFRNSALLSYLRKNRLEPYTGGVSMDEAFMYDSMIGGFYDTGEPLSTDVVQPIGGQTFVPRKAYTTVAEYMENLAVNRGPQAVFNSLRIKHKSAINTLNTIWNVSLYNHGQAISGDDRSSKSHGLEEALNDGVTQSWRGSTFTSYGGQTRNDGNVGAGYNSVPYFCGNSSTGAAGQLTYDKLVDMHLRATQGDRMPNLILSNKAVWGFGLKRIQAQQHFEFDKAVGTDAVFGARSIKFMGADWVIDQYAPSSSSQFGETNAKFGQSPTSATVTISGTPATGSNLPSSGTFVPAEALFMLNTETLKFRLSDHPYFKFGFSGWIPSQNTTKIVGRIHSMGTMYCTAPWLNVVGFGINS